MIFGNGAVSFPFTSRLPGTSVRYEVCRTKNPPPSRALTSKPQYRVHVLVLIISRSEHVHVASILSKVCSTILESPITRKSSTYTNTIPCSFCSWSMTFHRWGSGLGTTLYSFPSFSQVIFLRPSQSLWFAQSAGDST